MPHSKDVARLMSHHRLSALPVVDDDERVVGVVSETDLIVRDETFGRPHVVEGRRVRSLRRKEPRPLRSTT
ncbi:MAG: CBS domain-containing protein [Actinomycetota bacterium]